MTVDGKMNGLTALVGLIGFGLLISGMAIAKTTTVSYLLIGASVAFLYVLKRSIFWSRKAGKVLKDNDLLIKMIED